MKVATLWFDRTVHVHRRTSKTSAGISMSMSCLTLTWQDSRTSSRASPRDTWLVSVGSSAPPPDRTTTLQTPQVPFPPHADGMKILLAARVPSRVPPEGVWRHLSGSPLIVIAQSPVGTSCRRATISSPTRDTIVTVNIVTPSATVTIGNPLERVARSP